MRGVERGRERGKEGERDREGERGGEGGGREREIGRERESVGTGKVERVGTGTFSGVFFLLRSNEENVCEK